MKETLIKYFCLFFIVMSLTTCEKPTNYIFPTNEYITDSYAKIKQYGEINNVIVNEAYEFNLKKEYTLTTNNSNAINNCKDYYSNLYTYDLVNTLGIHINYCSDDSIDISMVIQFVVETENNTKKEMQIIFDNFIQNPLEITNFNFNKETGSVRFTGLGKLGDYYTMECEVELKVYNYEELSFSN